MAKFINTDTDTDNVLNISIIDPKTGADCINDLLQVEYDQNIGLDEDHNWLADSDVIEYYQDLASQYQTAYDLMHEIKQDGTDDDRQMLEDILEDAQGYETNDWAGYVIEDIKNKIFKKVTTTYFDYNYYSSEKHYDNVAHEEYVRHNADIFNEISYRGSTWQAVYQNGQSFRHGNFSAPCTTPELTSDAGTSETLVKINELYESDFDNKEYIGEFIEDLNDPAIETKEDLYTVYMALMDNNGLAIDEYKELFDDNDDFTPKIINDDFE